MEQDIISDYRERANTAAAEADKYKKLSDNCSLMRLGVFALFILAIVVSVSINSLVLLAVLALMLTGCFSWIVNRQNQFDDLKEYYLDTKKVCENEIDTILFNGNIYPDGSSFINDNHFYTSDLDVFGPNSLFQLVNRSATVLGCVKLAGWLNGPAAKDTILLRQQAASEIAQKNDWKIHTQANLVFSLKQPKEQIKNLFAYLKIPVEIANKRFLDTYSQLAPYILLASIILSIFYTPTRYAAGVIALVNLRLVYSQLKTINKTDLIAGKLGTALGHFVTAFKGIEQEDWQTDLLKSLVNRLKSNEAQTVSDAIKALSILIDKLNYRLNVVAAIFLNAFFLWDIRQIIAIEKWKTDNRERLEDAFEVLAEYEALISLASLHVNYPQWCFPEIVEGEGYTLTTKDLGHPLIKPVYRVTNDYELNDTYKIDIITGSNMAGKSTFLRTIGINAVLALCGAPVCAASMRVSEMTVLSYMRIKDSLNESTSTFKAELDRLKMLLAAVDSGQKVFFLIDEMLRGTNSVDKYLGSRSVIIRLAKQKGVGLVATHDLQIAELEKQYPDYIRNFYFDIQVKDGEMLFDYKMKEGECKTFNASMLLKQIGIDVEAE
ncbi:MAG: DNA mismatch repair protein MutS [Bacteroidetes bacterium]|nr:DNA mismatch repair protein MutS [Bacteroidota bacterium]